MSHTLTIFQRSITGIPHNFLARVALVLKNSLYLSCHCIIPEPPQRCLFYKAYKCKGEIPFGLHISKMLEKVLIILEWKTPWTIKNINQLLDFPQFSTITLVTLLTELLKREGFYWDPDYSHNNETSAYLCLYPCLPYPQYAPKLLKPTPRDICFPSNIDRIDNQRPYQKSLNTRVSQRLLYLQEIPWPKNLYPPNIMWNCNSTIGNTE